MEGKFEKPSVAGSCTPLTADSDPQEGRKEIHLMNRLTKPATSSVQRGTNETRILAQGIPVLQTTNKNGRAL